MPESRAYSRPRTAPARPTDGSLCEDADARKNCRNPVDTALMRARFRSFAASQLRSFAASQLRAELCPIDRAWPQSYVATASNATPGAIPQKPHYSPAMRTGLTAPTGRKACWRARAYAFDWTDSQHLGTTVKRPTKRRTSTPAKKDRSGTRTPQNQESRTGKEPGDFRNLEKDETP